jgi:hypothetical protein
MEAATLAVTRAENDADAVTYGGSSLIRARDALTRMNMEAGAKRYDAAKTLAAEAINAAEKALSDGQAGAARARQDASAQVNGLQTPLAETGNAINAAKQVPGIQLDFEDVDRDYAGAQSMADQARASLAGDDYPGAVSQCQNVRAALSGINTRIAGATQAVSRKK